MIRVGNEIGRNSAARVEHLVDHGGPGRDAACTKARPGRRRRTGVSSGPLMMIEHQAADARTTFLRNAWLMGRNSTAVESRDSGRPASLLRAE